MTGHQSGVQAAPSLSTEELETRSSQPSSPDSVKLKPSGEQVAFWGHSVRLAQARLGLPPGGHEEPLVGGPGRRELVFPA